MLWMGYFAHCRCYGKLSLPTSHVPVTQTNAEEVIMEVTLSDTVSFGSATEITSMVKESSATTPEASSTTMGVTMESTGGRLTTMETTAAAKHH